MGKQGLGLTQVQTQKLSPLQIQTIKLIELPVQDLEQRVRQELEENPVLDDTPDPNSTEQSQEVSLDQLQDDYIPDYKTRVNNWGKDARPEYNTFSVRQSFTQSLLKQLGFRHLSEQEQKIAAFIIGMLDEDGYLRRDSLTLVDDLAFHANITTDIDEVERMIAIIQDFEPAGVGARDLRECLLIQLRGMSRSEAVDNAITILQDYYKEFSSKHFQKIQQKMQISDVQLKDAIKRISRLNPKPGGQIDDSYSDEAQQIVPDFILTENDGEIGFRMPRFSVPEIRVSSRYSEMLNNSKGASGKAQKETLAFVKQKIDSAKWFVEALKQRKNTLEKTMQAILEYQHDYFLDGDESSLKPMVLKDIADKTGFDISTISRVVNSKYIETHFGIFPLKYFFSEGMENKNGEEVSTRELKKVLQEVVDAEDKKKPLTDEQLVEELSNRGYKVARRTIAKYRDQLGIPLARMRRQV